MINETITYDDKMGNIGTLQRRGSLNGVDSYGLMDNLTCTYTGNQLTKVTDAVTTPITYQGAFHFVDRTNVANEYTYDDNGNLTKDLNRNITSITYNELNLPNVITFSGNRSIIYGYDAAGNKLSVAYLSDGEPTKMEYVGNRVYNNNMMTTLLTDEGYIDTGTTPVYHYYLKDHQGNNRVVVNQAGTVEEVNHYYPFGGVFSELARPSIQRYKYNGKELDRKFDLDMLDYGARHYDPALGRWFTVDPMAEKYLSFSPYVYVGNNPVNRVDPTGMDWVEDENGNVIWRAEYTKDNLPEGYKYIGTEYTIGDTKFTQKTNKKGEVSLYASKVENKNSDQTSTQNATFAPALPWYTAVGEIIGTSALRMGGGVLSFLFLTGDTDPHKESLFAIDAYYPPPKELPGFPGAERISSKGNRARWRLPDGSIGEWDSQHGEVEVYDKTGKKHKGAYDPKTGEKKKEGKPSRKIEK